MIRLGAYKDGSRPEVDEAIRLAPQIETMLKQGKADLSSAVASFEALASILAPSEPTEGEE